MKVILEFDWETYLKVRRARDWYVAFYENNSLHMTDSIKDQYCEQLKSLTEIIKQYERTTL